MTLCMTRFKLSLIVPLPLDPQMHLTFREYALCFLIRDGIYHFHKIEQLTPKLLYRAEQKLSTSLLHIISSRTAYRTVADPGFSRGGA